MSEDLTSKNKAFWNELCGTFLLGQKGIHVSGPEDLPAFDAFYFDFYPFLKSYLDRLKVQGKSTLEIGLGVGTVGQYLFESGARYTGLDLAQEPVSMMKTRIENFGSTSEACAIRGNALSLPFADESLDVVVAIGSLHHTGDLAGAIEEVHRALKPGGQSMIMVYNRFSYVQWVKWPLKTTRAFLGDLGVTAPYNDVDESQRFLYDRDSKGDAAPCTELTSVSQAREYFKGFRTCEIYKDNCTNFKIGGKVIIPRLSLLPILRPLGADLYIHAVK